MTLIYVDDVVTGPMIGIDLGSTDSLVVSASGIVGGTDNGSGSSSIGVQMNGSRQTITVAGVISGSSSIFMESGTVTVTSTGLLVGQINIRGGWFLNNAGTIIGGVVASSNDRGKIINSGQITGNINDEAQVNGGGAYNLLNTGEILGGVVFYGGELTNRGLIVGNIQLRGATIYDGRGGTVEGSITASGGLSNIFKPGYSPEDINSGGGGQDLLDFRGLDGITVSLDNSIQGSKTAAGDTYVNFENVYGTLGNDIIVGSGGANKILGFYGRDSLFGGTGADTITGGSSIDRITGGPGNDVFVFNRLVEAGDVITDFSGKTGNDDMILLSFREFPGVNAGTLFPGRFITRADNRAQDANDHIIFRTTDRTLWYDANGNAAGGLKLLADLQPGAVVTVNDIQGYFG